MPALRNGKQNASLTITSPATPLGSPTYTPPGIKNRMNT